MEGEEHRQSTVTRRCDGVTEGRPSKSFPPHSQAAVRLLHSRASPSGRSWREEFTPTTDWGWWTVPLLLSPLREREHLEDAAARGRQAGFQRQRQPKPLGGTPKPQACQRTQITLSVCAVSDQQTQRTGDPPGLTFTASPWRPCSPNSSNNSKGSPGAACRQPQCGHSQPGEMFPRVNLASPAIQKGRGNHGCTQRILTVRKATRFLRRWSA